MAKIGPGPKSELRDRRMPGMGLTSAQGRRGFIPPGMADPTPGTTNLITANGDRLITADAEELIVRP